MAKKNKTPHYKTDNMGSVKDEVEIEPIVKFVVESWDNWDSHWANKLSEFERYYDRWIGIPPSRDESWQAQFNKKLTWQAEKVLVSRQHSALFPNSAPIDVDATEVTDELQGILNKSMVAHWFKIGKFSNEFLKGMRSAGIYGTGYFEDDWYVRKENTFEKETIQIADFRNMIDEGGNILFDEEGNVRVKQVGTRPTTKEKSRMKVVEDRYRVRKANIFAWRVHPHKLSIEDNYGAIKQEFITFDDLVQRQEELEKYGISGFENIDKIKEDKFKIDDKDVKRLQKDGDYIDEKNPRLELLSYWGEYAELKDNRLQNSKPMLIMVVNRKFKLQAGDNPFWHKKSPLIKITWTEDEKPSWYGIGLAKIGGPAEDRANTSVNIRTDVLKKNVRGSGFYNALDKKIKKAHLVDNTPGRMRPCSDVNKAVSYDNPPSLRAEDYREEEVAVNDHREITGANTALLPAADTGQQHDTLGGMQLMVGQASIRLKPDMIAMEIDGIRQFANRGFLLTRQFYTQEQAVELVASDDQKKQFHLEKIYKMTPADIIGKANFVSTGLNESVDKAQNIDKLLKYAEVTGKIPPMQAITNYTNIAKRIALWLGFEDVEDFVQMNPNNPMLPMPQQQPNVPGQGIPGALPGSPQGGLPAQILQQIAQGIGQGQRPVV